MNDNNQITIGFHMKDTNGGVYSQESTLEIFFDQGEDELDVIGRQLNSFLRQVGYLRPNDNILLEDLSDEEYEDVAYFLRDLRDDGHVEDEE